MPKQYKPVTEQTVRTRLKHKYRLTNAQIAVLPDLDTVNQVVQSQLAQLSMKMFEAILTPEDRDWLSRPKTIEEMFAGLTPERPIPLNNNIRALMKSQQTLALFALNNLFAVHHQGNTTEDKKKRNELAMRAYRKICTRLIEAVHLQKRPKSRLDKMLVGYFTVSVGMIDAMHNRPIEQIQGYGRPTAKRARTKKPNGKPKP